MTFLLFVALITFTATLVCVWLVREMANRFGFVSVPKENRWHTRPTALYGGIGIFVPFMSVVAALVLFSQPTYFSREFLALLLGAFLMCILGLLDDRFSIKPATKLIGQIIAVSIPLSTGFVAPFTDIGIANTLLTLFWFILIINAVNILDNMDGLSAGIVTISLATLLVIHANVRGFDQKDFFQLLVVALIASTLAFLVYNSHPASIFMGDTGSLFLGYLLAGLALPTSLNGFFATPSVVLVPVIPLIVLAAPLFETVLVSFSRLSSGRSPLQGGRDHSSHRLVGLGFSERQAAFILYGIAWGGGLIAVIFHSFPLFSAFFALVYILVLFFIGSYLARVQVYSDPALSVEKKRLSHFISNILYKRHAAEVLLDVILIVASYYFAYYLRFESLVVDPSISDLFVRSLPLVIAGCIFGLYLGGVYRGIWHFITVSDVFRYARGVLFGVAMSVFGLVALYRFIGYSRAVFVIFTVLFFLLLVGSRLSFRMLDDLVRRRARGNSSKNVVIYGAGRGGKLLLEECLQNSQYRDVRVLGFIDDDANKRMLTIAGVTVYDPSSLATLGRRRSIDELWVSSSKIDCQQVLRLARGLDTVERPVVRVRRFTCTVEEFEIQ